MVIRYNCAIIRLQNPRTCRYFTPKKPISIKMHQFYNNVLHAVMVIRKYAIAYFKTICFKKCKLILYIIINILRNFLIK